MGSESLLPYDIIDYQFGNLLFMTAVIIIKAIKRYKNYGMFINLKEIVTQNLISISSCIRNGKLEKLSHDQIVVGDVIKVFTGDIIGVDGILIEGHDLFIQQNIII